MPLPNLAGRRSRRLPLLAVVLAMVAGACARAPAPDRPVPDLAGTVPAPVQAARAAHGMVASASPAASEVGALILTAGGNAVDAAVATGFALAVVEPSMSGLGGRASMMIRLVDGAIAGIDGLNQVPHGFREGAPPGYAAAAVPGIPAALVKAHERYGRLPLRDVLAPAIRLAEEGFPLSAAEARRLEEAAGELRRFPASQRYFLKPDGGTYRAGERFVQRDLGRTLRAIAEHGADGFYRGWVADSVHADMAANGGFITREEMENYRALPAILVRGEYRGHRLVAPFRPASGHSVVQALQMLEGFDLASLDDAAWAAVVAQAMHLALGDRHRELGTEDESALRLSSREWAAERAREIVAPQPVTLGPSAGGAAALAPGTRSALTEAGHTTQPAAAPSGLASAPLTRSAAAASGHTTQPAAGASDLAPAPQTRSAVADADNTTHLSVVDADGNVVALTQSVGPSLGTRLAASGAGFLYATRLGAEPGSRPSSTISPTLLLRPDGEPLYALGGAGDARIITAVVQTLSRAVDRGLPLDEAVAAPRVHPTGPRGLRLEEGAWSDEDRARLAQLGFEISASPPSWFGRVHAVAFDSAGTSFFGVAEPRGHGAVAWPILEHGTTPAAPAGQPAPAEGAGAGHDGTAPIGGPALLEAPAATPAVSQRTTAGTPSATAGTAPILRVDALLAELEPEIQRTMLAGNIPSATIALVAGDRVVWQGAYGYSNLWARTPATTNTVYLIASTFKAMANAALLEVMRREGIGLDEPVSQYLGELRIPGENPAAPITFRHLMTHVSGLPVAFSAVDVWGDEVPPALEEYLSERLRLEGPPLERVRYSNMGYTLLAHLLERITGEPFRDHIGSAIFEPLDMTSTAFIPTPDMQERLAVPYTLEGGRHTPARRSKFAEWPAGGVYGTIEDQAKWLIANLNGGVYNGQRVIDETLLHEMHTLQYPQLAQPSADFGGEVTGYGLTWRLATRRGERLFAHSGSVAGYTGLIVGNLDRRIGFAILTNGHRAHPHLYRLADTALELLKRHGAGD